MNEVNVLITGATGFIGKALTKKLLGLNFKILALSRNYIQQTNNENITWLKADLNDFENIKEEIKNFKPEIIIHLSWENIPIFNLENSLKNLNNSINFFNFIFSLNSCKKILVSGSCLEYSKSIGSCKESEKNISNNFLAWAKESLRSWLEMETLKSGCKLGWFRIFYVYGPHQRENSLIPSLVNTFKNKKPILINNIFNSNDFIYVNDVADAFIAFLKLEVPSGIYNLGSGKSLSILEISYIVEELILGTRKRTKLFLQKSENINKKNEVNFIANIEKTQLYLRWKPKHKIESGILKTINS